MNSLRLLIIAGLCAVNVGIYAAWHSPLNLAAAAFLGIISLPPAISLGRGEL